MQPNPFLRSLPAVTVIALAVLAMVLSFNGLYGQDAHEYLRLSRACFDLLQGLPYAHAGRGDAEFAIGYPLAGALLQAAGLNAIAALQIVSALSAGVALYFFNRCLLVLSPGARMESRLVFAGVGLALAPCFLRAGLTVMSDALGLAMTMASLAHGLRVLETGKIGTAAGAAFFAGLALITRFSMAALILPVMLAVGVYLLNNRRWVFALVCTGAAGLAVMPHFWFRAGLPGTVLDHSLLQDWSVLNLFRSTFSNSNGAAAYTLPNGLYMLFPLAHPAFCLALPGLLLLSKKTDLHLSSKKILAGSLGLYLLFLGGIPHQNLRYLLPAYAVLLLLFFPAWDRLFAYGSYFFKRLTYSIIGATIALQILSGIWFIRPVIARNHLETQIATTLQRRLPSGAVLFAFDLDIALHSYLKDVRIISLWEKQYTAFPPGSFILFNEAGMQQQWAGRAPMLNWELAKSNYTLSVSDTFDGGWRLYEIKGPLK